MEVQGGAHLYLQPMEDPMPEQVDAQRRLWCDAKLILEQVPGRTCDCGEPILEQPVPEGLHSVEKTDAGAGCEEL